MSNIYKDIRQSRLCSARLEASSGSRSKGVPTYNQRGWRSGPGLLWGALDKSRHIVPTALLVRMQCFRKDLYKAVEGQSTRPIVLPMITGSFCRRRRRSWAASSHLRPPIAFLSHKSSDTSWLAPRMNVLFWGFCDFPISISGRDR